MKLTWYGHSCFKLETSCGSLVFDPYEDITGPGLLLPKNLEADTVICSHDHYDHNYRKGVKLTGAPCGISIKQFKTFHDPQQGRLRGNNLMTKAEACGISILHAGDLGHALSAEQTAEIGKVDVLLLPVGGKYTVDAEEAFDVMKSLSPKLTIPMHYREGNKGLQDISEAADFCGLFGNGEIAYLDRNDADIENLLAMKKKVAVFKWPDVR